MSKIDTEATAAAKPKFNEADLSLAEWVERRTTALWAHPVKLDALGPDRQALWANRRGNPVKWQRGGPR